MKKKKYLLLTFDLEEFDFPSEFGIKQTQKEKFEVSRMGLNYIISILEQSGIKATFFTTASFASNNKSLLIQISRQNEIALHGLNHYDDYGGMTAKTAIGKLRKAAKAIKSITSKNLYGFRAPRLFQKDWEKVDLDFVKKAGIIYDSSLHPTLVPGRYNNFFQRRKVHRIGEIIEVPISVSPIFRLPLSWFAFRNLGKNYCRFVTNFNFIDSDYTLIFFHPWEFVDLKKMKMKLSFLDNILYTRNTGKNLMDSLKDYINWAKKKGYEFCTVSQFLYEKKYLS
ncbi:MAG: polysaccharide deacetylase family protein [archaeon]